MVIDPAIEAHYGTGYERSRLFPGGQPSLEYVRSMELLERLLPGPPARVLDVGGGPGTYAAPQARRGYRDGLAGEIEQAGFTGVTVYGVEGPGRPLRQQWTDPRRREHILFAARSAETQLSLIGFSHHLIAAATTTQTSSQAA